MNAFLVYDMTSVVEQRRIFPRQPSQIPHAVKLMFRRGLCKFLPKFPDIFFVLVARDSLYIYRQLTSFHVVGFAECQEISVKYLTWPLLPVRF